MAESELKAESSVQSKGLVGGFDIRKFNSAFEEQIQRIKSEQELDEKSKLDKLNTLIVEQPLYSLSIGQLLINTKDAWFDMLDDILTFNPKIIFNLRFLTKNHRLFYIGLTIVSICIFLFLYNLLVLGNKCDKTKVKRIDNHYYYHNKENSESESKSESELEPELEPQSEPQSRLPLMGPQLEPTSEFPLMGPQLEPKSRFPIMGPQLEPKSRFNMPKSINTPYKNPISTDSSVTDQKGANPE